MSVVITRDDIIAYAEVDYIIHHMNEKYVERVPEKLLAFFATIKDPTYEVYVDPHKPLQNQNLKKYTLELIALLHLKYWCDDEERRKMLYERMMENQYKLDEQMREKYNIDNMFDLNSAKVVNDEEDLENSSDNQVNEYSHPKNVTKYQTMAEENPDILDYTDVEEVNENKLKNYFSQDTDVIDKLNNQEKAIIEKTSFITSFITNFIKKIKSIFSKQK